MDIVYQSLVIYFMFFVIYALIKGNFFEEKFELVFNDPLIFILVAFIVVFLFIMILNIIRSPKIILSDDRIIFKNRFGSREVFFNEIMNVKISRKRRRTEDGDYRTIKIKLRNRRKLLRIRANEFEKGHELIKEFLKLRQSHKNE